jgi:quercetin dioxygenase-like cupin family protein
MPVASSASKRPDQAHVRIFEFRQDSERQVTDWASEGVRATGLLKVNATADISWLRFETGASLGRHPTGRQQVFAVIEGEGWVQAKGQEARRIVTGDSAATEPNEVHWHGAGRLGPMAHVVVNFGDTTWMTESPAPPE